VPDGARAFDAVLTDLIRAGNDPRASDANKKRIAREERIQRDLTRNAPVVFVDGKHEGRVVAAEGAEIASRQAPGDVVVFDDVHLPDVKQAVSGLHNDYAIEWLQVLPKRAYAIGVRR